MSVAALINLVPLIVRHVTGRCRRYEISSQVGCGWSDQIATAVVLAEASCAQPHFADAGTADYPDVVANLGMGPVADVDGDPQRVLRDPR